MLRYTHHCLSCILYLIWCASTFLYNDEPTYSCDSFTKTFLIPSSLTTFRKTKCGNLDNAIPINITGTFVFADYVFLLELANPDDV